MANAINFINSMHFFVPLDLPFHYICNERSNVVYALVLRGLLWHQLHNLFKEDTKIVFEDAITHKTLSIFLRIVFSLKYLTSTPLQTDMGYFCAALIFLCTDIDFPLYWSTILISYWFLSYFIKSYILRFYSNILFFS